MSNLQKQLTLRQYLDEVNTIKKVKSLTSIHSLEAFHRAEKSTEELQKQTQEKVSEIRKLLNNKNNKHREYDLLQTIYELSNIINHVFEKLRRLQGKPESNKNIKISQSNNLLKPKIDYLKTSENEIQLTPPIPKQTIPNQLIAPQLLSRQIKFSTDNLSNLESSTTGDLSPTRDNIQKLYSIQQSMGKKNKTHGKGILKTVKSVEGLNIQKQTKDMISSSVSYKIKVSICE